MSGDAAMAIRSTERRLVSPKGCAHGEKYFERNVAGNGLWRSGDWESGLGPGRLSLHNQTDEEFYEPGDRHP
jgi:hypothetical protein